MNRKKVLVPIKTRKYFACPSCGMGSFFGPFPDLGTIPTLCKKCNSTYDVVFYTRKSRRASIRIDATLKDVCEQLQYVKIRDISRVGVGLTEINNEMKIGARYVMIFTLKSVKLSVVIEIKRVDHNQCGAEFCFDHDCAEEKAIISYMMEREVEE